MNDEYAKLVAKGVYCESCGCYTNQELGVPTLCYTCTEKEHADAIENAIERGEEI